MTTALSFNLPKLHDSVTSAPVIAGAVLSTAFFLTTSPISGPTAADHFAALGTAFAAVVVLIGVRQKDKSLMNCAAVLAGTLIVGICMPGLLVGFSQSNPDHAAAGYNYLDWRLYVILGFVCGLGGWSVTQALYNAFTKLIPSIIDSIIRRFFSRWTPPPDDRPPTV